MTQTDLSIVKDQADQLFRRKRLIGFGFPSVIAAYLIYIFFAFDLPGLAQRANLDVVPELVIAHSPVSDAIRVLPWFDDLKPFSIGVCAQQRRLDDPLLAAFWRQADPTRGGR